MLIDRVFEALEVRMEPFALCQLQGRCQMGFARRPFAILHYVLQGTGEIMLGTGRAMPVRPGTIVLIPAFQQHRLAGHGTGADPLPDCKPLEIGMEHLQASGTDSEQSGCLVAICGQLDISVKGVGGSFPLIKTPIFETLPEGDRVRKAMQDLIDELSEPQIGTRVLARSLMEQSLILLLRRQYLSGDEGVRWIDGLADEKLWCALQVMLDRPSEPHTVESLADVAGVSRSVLADRFTRVYGAGPIDLLRSIRLQKAAELLATSDVPVKRVSEMIGYSSRSYFSKAFEDKYGVRPQGFRREMAE